MLKRIFALLLLGSICLCAQDKDQTAETDKKEPKLPVHHETVVVTGTFQPLPLEEADRAVTSLDTREAPLLFTSFIEYLRTDPSIDLRERGPADVQADVSIRGGTFGQTLVLVNGVRFNDPQSGHHNFDMPLPLSSMERIEVLRGAGSTFYGADALGGAVNFITAPASVSEFRFGSAYGNFGVNEQHGAATYSTKRFSEQVSFGRSLSSGFMADRDYRTLELASDTHIKNALGYFNTLLAYGDKPFGANQFYGPYNSWERTKSWFASFSQDFGTKTQAVFAFHRHTDDFVLFRDKPSYYENNHIDLSYEAALRRHDSVAHNATLSYGIEGYHDSIDSTNLYKGGLYPALGEHERNRGALYLNLDVRALRRFSFSVGGREEVYSGAQTKFSPNVSAGYWLSSKLKLRGAASHGFRLPTYTDLYYHDPISKGNPNLSPETAWSFEGGLDWNTSGKLGGSITMFHRRQHNGIDYVSVGPQTPTNPGVASNIGNLRFTGLEAAVRLRLPHEQRVDITYTGMIADADSLGNLVARYAFEYPKNSGAVSWQGRLPGKLLGRTRVGVLERRDYDAYALWDLSLMRTFSFFTPYVQLSNLSNTGYREILIPNPGVLMPGRSAVVGMEFALSRKSK